MHLLLKRGNMKKKFIIIYSVILIILMSVSLSYVYRSLVLYEKNQPTTFINDLMEKLKTNPNKYINIKKEHVEGYKDILKNDYTVEESTDKYQVLVDNIPIFDITLNKDKSVNKLGLLNYHELSLKEIKAVSENGAYYYKVIIPKSFTLKVDGNIIDKSNDEIVYEEFEEINLLPKDNVFILENFSKKPKIDIINNDGKTVTPVINGSTITCHEFKKTDDYKSVIKDPIDILDFAQKWSLFLSNDLKGTNRGLGIINQYLVSDSTLGTFARDWARGIDITFISKHTLKNPTFTDMLVNDCYIYNEDAFSCHVKLNKNMIVSGKDKVEKINDRMYFVYDNTWKLIDMRVVTK